MTKEIQMIDEEASGFERQKVDRLLLKTMLK